LALLRREAGRHASSSPSPAGSSTVAAIWFTGEIRPIKLEIKKNTAIPLQQLDYSFAILVEVLL
jgi:hypothetical protein